MGGQGQCKEHPSAERIALRVITSQRQSKHPCMQVFELVDPELFVQWKQRDGDRVSKGAFFGEVSGSARSILTAERIALNFMQRMSGIATATRQMVEAVQVWAFPIRKADVIMSCCNSKRWSGKQRECLDSRAHCIATSQQQKASRNLLQCMSGDPGASLVTGMLTKMSAPALGAGHWVKDPRDKENSAMSQIIGQMGRADWGRCQPQDWAV